MTRRQWLDALAGFLVGLGIICVATSVYIGFWAWDASQSEPGVLPADPVAAETGYRLASVGAFAGDWAIVGVLVIALGAGVFAAPRFASLVAYLRGGRGKGSLVFIRRRRYRRARQ
jgi:hypothetical protein